MSAEFQKKVIALRERHEQLLSRKNSPKPYGNGIYDKYEYPIITAEHTPLEWRYDFSEHDNPYLMQRIMINATFNSGAIKIDGRYLLVVRVEGADRKSFFAVAESPNGIDNFRFWDEPITMPDDIIPATNIYDMRLTQHEDGWIYGIFCAERHDDTSRRRKGLEPDPPPPNHTAMRNPTQTENSCEVLRAYPTGAERCREAALKVEG